MPKLRSLSGVRACAVPIRARFDFSPLFNIVYVMKTAIVAILLVAAAAQAGFGQAKTVVVDSVPPSMENLLAVRDGIATAPEGGAVVFLLAMIMYGVDRDLGLQAFTLALDMHELSAGTVYKGFRPTRDWDDRFAQIDPFPFLGRIYVNGTKPADGYALPKGSLEFTVTEVRLQKDGSAKVFVATTSGNMPRPLTLVKNDKGLWKVTEASSVFVGPSALPQAKDTDDL
jgi:hypothetical protein